jgi:hypothetical protein
MIADKQAEKICVASVGFADANRFIPILKNNRCVGRDGPLV